MLDEILSGRVSSYWPEQAQRGLVCRGLLRVESKGAGASAVFESIAFAGHTAHIGIDESSSASVDECVAAVALLSVFGRRAAQRLFRYTHVSERWTHYLKPLPRQNLVHVAPVIKDASLYDAPLSTRPEEPSAMHCK